MDLQYFNEFLGVALKRAVFADEARKPESVWPPV